MPQTWLEARVEVSTESAEAAAVCLLESGSPGLVTEDAGERTRLIAYFESDEQVRAARRALAAIDEAAALDVGEISSENWAENWKTHFPPISVGDRFHLCPPWATEPPAGRRTIVIDPGMAFGTGHHATTRACLELLESRDLERRDVLDVGTGSGVLSIAALLLGARRAVGVDVDPIALEAARGNAARNRVESRFETVASLDDTEGPFDVALANIQLSVLRAIEERLAARVRPGGILIASGLLREEAAAWERAYAERWEIGESRGDAEWVAIAARRRTAEEDRGGIRATPAPPARRERRVQIDAGAIRDGVVEVTGAELRHLRVRRLRAGDAVVCFDVEGVEYDGRVLSLASRAARIELGESRRPERESPLSLSLAQAMLKGDRLDLVVEKATELGVREIVLFTCERSLARPSPARLERLRRIAASAAKQSGRVHVPAIRGPVALDDVLAPGGLLFQPGAEGRLSDTIGGRRALTAVVGPEGGFDDAEIERAVAAGCSVVGLGPRILRAETAAVVVAALCQYVAGDLGGHS